MTGRLACSLSCWSMLCHAVLCSLPCHQVVFMDEPTSGLDARAAGIVMVRAALPPLPCGRAWCRQSGPPTVGEVPLAHLFACPPFHLRRTQSAPQWTPAARWCAPSTRQAGPGFGAHGTSAAGSLSPPCIQHPGLTLFAAPLRCSPPSTSSRFVKIFCESIDSDWFSTNQPFCCCGAAACSSAGRCLLPTPCSPLLPTGL